MSEEQKVEATEDDTEEKGKRLTAEEWHKIEVYWELGTMGTKALGAMFGVSPQAIRKHMSTRPHIVKNSKAHLNHQRAAQLAAMPPIAPPPPSDFETKRKARIEQTKEAIYRATTTNAIVFGRIQKDIVDGVRTIADAKSEIIALRHAEAYLKLSSENRYKVLDIEGDVDERDLPSLILEDLTKEEIQKIQQGEEDDLDALDLPDAPEDPDENDVIEEGRP